MMEVALLDIEVTEDGTIVENMRIVDIRDAIIPARLWIREWIDERHYRDVQVADELWSFPSRELFCRQTAWAKGIV